MNYRPLGATGLKVSELGFGCSKLGGTVERHDNREVTATLHEALASGVNFFDTADIYAQGHAEELLGKVASGRRTSVVIAGKAGFRLSAAGGFLARLKPLVRPLLGRMRSASAAALRVREAQMRQDFSPEYLRAAVEGSLRRLRTDYLDLLQLHNPPAEATASDGLREVLERLRRDGKIRHFGIACAHVADAWDWIGFPGVASLQIRMKGDPLPVLGAASRKGIGILVRGQESLGFALQFPEVSSVIVGMRSRAHLRENVGAAGTNRRTDKAHAY